MIIYLPCRARMNSEKQMRTTLQVLTSQIYEDSTLHEKHAI